MDVYQTRATLYNLLRFLLKLAKLFVAICVLPKHPLVSVCYEPTFWQLISSTNMFIPYFIYTGESSPLLPASARLTSPLLEEKNIKIV
uniref:Secreted protein n=1 Tax=Pyxicephalus adspersus TaxID=30357 RepID=A0AAV3A304_PYXAD|nr:TPA: hypothetical protein GDO54_017682 [Pyxicephalus adspersus]